MNTKVGTNVMNVIPLKPENKDLKKKIKELNKIAFSVDAAKRGSPSPRVMFAALVSTGGLAVYFLVFFVISHLEHSIEKNFWIPFLCMCIAFIAGYISTGRPGSWGEEIDDLLFLYEPVNKKAYAELQAQCADSVIHDYEAIEAWAVMERIQVIEGMKGRKPLKFTKRKM